MAQLAAFPNVHAKVSGLTTCADWAHWTPEDLQPYVDHAIDVFGPDRLMSGGDWPVSLLAGDDARVWDATHALLSGLGDHERGRVIGGTAIEAYNLPVGS